MSREFTFRAWTEDRSGNGVGGYDYGGWCLHASGLFMPDAAVWLKGKTPIIEQYTGVKDRNGKKIFEGDIVRCLSGIHWAITWCAAGYDGVRAFHPIDIAGRHENYYYGGWEPDEFVVVGNIHENPELLNGD